MAIKIITFIYMFTRLFIHLNLNPFSMVKVDNMIFAVGFFLFNTVNMILDENYKDFLQMKFY